MGKIIEKLHLALLLKEVFCLGQIFLIDKVCVCLCMCVCVCVFVCVCVSESWVM